MKLYKLWLEIEELDTDSGEYRNLAEEGLVAPVPIAVFSSLDEARRHAESFATDEAGLRDSLRILFDIVN